MTALVIAEHDHGALKPATLNTVTAAKACGGEVHVLVAGHNASGAAQSAAAIAGVAKILHADGASLAEQLAENVAAQVLQIAMGYTHLLFPATAHGKNVAPRVAALLDAAQISDATKIVAADTFERHGGGPQGRPARGRRQGPASARGWRRCTSAPRPGQGG